MINIRFIPSEDNLPTHIYTEVNSFNYRYSEDYETKENRVYYDAFLVDSDALISSGNLCVVTNPYESEEFVERCEKVKLDDGREVFYGEGGTRCLLCDVGKIIAVNMEFIKGKDINILHTEIIFSFLNKNPNKWF